jgi:hydroxymethylpyrimidine/phosphomethylpyrimidine kinase
VTPRVVLTIAGSDSGGGAGLQADLRTFAALGVHGAVAVSAVTAQSSVAVTAVLAVEAAMVREQVLCVTGDLELAAAKTGMLARPATVLEVARLADDGRLPRLVVDPVLVSSTGHLLMEDGGVEAYRDALFAHAAVITPNLREAAVLLGVDVASLASTSAMADAATALRATGARCVVVKGGHLLEGAAAERAPDVVASDEGVTTLDGPRIATRNDHGTGCSLSAAIAVGLAEGRDALDAVVRAKAFVAAGLTGSSSWRLGAGHGPIDHLGWGGDT